MKRAGARCHHEKGSAPAPQKRKRAGARFEDPTGEYRPGTRSVSDGAAKGSLEVIYAFIGVAVEGSNEVLRGAPEDALEALPAAGCESAAPSSVIHDSIGRFATTRDAN